MSVCHSPSALRPLAAAALLLGASGLLQAQPAAQVVKPPVSQAWIDLATFSGPGMPGAGANPMAALGGLFGGGGGGNRFGMTQGMPGSGRYVDVTLYTRLNPQLQEATQAVPAGFLSPALTLQSPKETRGTPPDPGDERPVDTDVERPKGRLMLYWGCGAAVRAGQPRVIDFAKLNPADLAKVFQARRATQRGTHLAAGRPVWPSPADARSVPAQASLVGEHAFSGQGVPEGFKFRVGPQQDLMPAIALKQTDQGGATLLEWQPLPTARAYFIAAMGGRETPGDGGDMIVWTSSEVPETGFGLIDYQTNPAVDRWLTEKVLLPPQASRCELPKGVFAGAGGMLRLIAYGSELNLAYPPRPADPRQPWEPQWAVKLRLKSVAMGMLGMPGAAPMPDAGQPTQPADEPKPDDKPGLKDVLKGLFGR
jgi:hypothetical protein